MRFILRAALLEGVWEGLTLPGESISIALMGGFGRWMPSPNSGKHIYHRIVHN